MAETSECCHCDELTHNSCSAYRVRWDIFRTYRFFSLIGVIYESIGSLFQFVLYCFSSRNFFEVIKHIILLFTVGKISRNSGKWIWIACIKLVLTWIVIHLVHARMTTIVLSGFAELLTPLLIMTVHICLMIKRDLIIGPTQ